MGEDALQDRAREVVVLSTGWVNDWAKAEAQVLATLQAVRAEEREACARIAEADETCRDPKDGFLDTSYEEWSVTAKYIAAAIRARTP